MTKDEFSHQLSELASLYLHKKSYGGYTDDQNEAIQKLFNKLILITFSDYDKNSPNALLEYKAEPLEIATKGYKTAEEFVLAELEKQGGYATKYGDPLIFTFRNVDRKIYYIPYLIKIGFGEYRLSKDEVGNVSINHKKIGNINQDEGNKGFRKTIFDRIVRYIITKSKLKFWFNEYRVKNGIETPHKMEEEDEILKKLNEMIDNNNDDIAQEIKYFYLDFKKQVKQNEKNN